MRGMFFRGVVLGSLTAALVLSASAALAGTGIGGIFNLGQSNTVNQTSGLSGSSSGAQLAVSNTSTSTGNYGLRVNGASATPALVAHNSAGPAALFFSPTSAAPFAVNSTRKVTNLNADLLNGIGSRGFVQGQGKVYTLAVAIPRENGSVNDYQPSPAVVPGFANIGYQCPPLGSNASATSMEVTDLSGGALNLFYKNNLITSARYDDLPVTGGRIGFGTATSADITTMTIQGQPASTGLQTVTTATASSLVRSYDCHFQIQALTTNP